MLDQSTLLSMWDVTFRCPPPPPSADWNAPCFMAACVRTMCPPDDHMPISVASAPVDFRICTQYVDQSHVTNTLAGAVTLHTCRAA